MKVSAIILDCDGVMFDSKEANTNYYNSILHHFGLPSMGVENIEFTHMHTAEESLKQIFKGTPYLDEAQNFCLKYDYTPFIDDMKIEPGLKKVLDVLKPDYGLAVATSRSNTIGKVLETNGLNNYFDIVVSSLDVKHPKPHPESVFKILDFFKIGPEECLYIGDSEVDYKVCKAAGVSLISYGNGSIEGDWQIEALVEVLDILGENGL